MFTFISQTLIEHLTEADVLSPFPRAPVSPEGQELQALLLDNEPVASQRKRPREWVVGPLGSLGDHVTHQLVDGNQASEREVAFSQPQEGTLSFQDSKNPAVLLQPRAQLPTPPLYLCSLPSCLRCPSGPLCQTGGLTSCSKEHF